MNGVFRMMRSRFRTMRCLLRLSGNEVSNNNPGGFCVLFSLRTTFVYLDFVFDDIFLGGVSGRMAGWVLAGWVHGWLGGWLAWLAGWMAGWLASWMQSP